MEMLRLWMFAQSALAMLAKVPDLIFQGVVFLCKGLYYAVSIPCAYMRDKCGRPCYAALCLPGGCVFVCKESCVNCCERCTRCCCPRSASGDDYGSGIKYGA